jgi:hypothetical protein
MMERTELREQFFDEVKKDPYAHMITRLVSDMWVEGYRQAMQETNNMDLYHEQGYDRLRHKALEWLTDSRKKAQADMVIAMAQIGPLVNKPFSPA